MTIPADQALFLDQLHVLAECMKNDYLNNWGGSGFYDIVFEHGSKYVKVVNLTGSADAPHRSCHGFVVIADGPKFKRGDMLKCATWATPAKNFKRGNIFNLTKTSHVAWTGIGN